MGLSSNLMVIEKISENSLIAQIIIGVFSLFVAIVCFLLLDSSAEGTLGNWKVGGAMAGFILTYYLVNKYYESPSEQNVKISKIPNRTEYFDTILKSVENAKESVSLCVHTLEPSHKNENIRTLQEKLENANATNKKVRILAPPGEDRVEAAYEIKKKNIPIKFLNSLKDEDFKFTVVDKNITVISIGPSSSEVGVIIESERLNELLRNYFNSLWDQPEAKEYDLFLSDTIREFGDTVHTSSSLKISEKLKIPVDEIDRVHAISK